MIHCVYYSYTRKYLFSVFGISKSIVDTGAAAHQVRCVLRVALSDMEENGIIRVP